MEKLDFMLSRVLCDTGSTTVGVNRRFVTDDQLTNMYQHCLMFGGNVERYLVATIFITTLYYKGYLDAYVIDNPVHDLILGNIKGINETAVPNVEVQNVKLY